MLLYFPWHKNIFVVSFFLNMYFLKADYLMGYNRDDGSALGVLKSSEVSWLSLRAQESDCLCSNPNFSIQIAM